MVVFLSPAYVTTFIFNPLLRRVTVNKNESHGILVSREP